MSDFLLVTQQSSAKHSNKQKKKKILVLICVGRCCTLREGKKNINRPRHVGKKEEQEKVKYIYLSNGFQDSTAIRNSRETLYREINAVHYLTLEILTDGRDPKSSPLQTFTRVPKRV